MSVSDKNFESFMQKFAGTLLEPLDALKGSKQVLLLADECDRSGQRRRRSRSRSAA